MAEYFVYDFLNKRYASRLNGLSHALALASKAQRESFTRVIVEIDERRKPLVVFDNRAQSKGGRVINCLRFEAKKPDVTVGEEQYLNAVERDELPESELNVAKMIVRFGFDSICRFTCKDAVEEESMMDLFRD